MYIYIYIYVFIYIYMYIYIYIYIYIYVFIYIYTYIYIERFLSYRKQLIIISTASMEVFIISPILSIDNHITKLHMI